MDDASVKHRKSKHNLQELVDRIPKGYKCEEIDLGNPVGKEVL
jgi:antitoxin component of MazEF toxin-antitoxin module